MRGFGCAFFVFGVLDMRYEDRFTARVCLPDNAVDEHATYLSRVASGDNEIILKRLGMYEDLGFSPAELAHFLLECADLDADQMERIKIALVRIEAFDKKGYYLDDFRG